MNLSREASILIIGINLEFDSTWERSSMPRYLTANEAAAVMGVSRQTLYAYVSRGLLQVHPRDGSRESRYLAGDVERLSKQRKSGRKPREIAKATLNWGQPVLESRITLIDDGRLFYRGEDAATLATSESLEDVAALLWQCAATSAFPASAPDIPPRFDALASAYAGRRAEDALLPLFTLISDDADTANTQRFDQRRIEGCGALVRLITACLLGASPSAEPIHLQCARAWNLDAAGASLVRIALILCCDHELNASSFTARCIASTGASLRAAVIGGLAALTGDRHGATTTRCELLWDEVGSGLDVVARLQQRLARGDDLPGFGHQLYPAGDIRAATLLKTMLPHHPGWQEVIDGAYALLGQYPSLDFALVALRRHLNLPPGAAFGLFALGRSVGWIAHALEQRESDRLIRPRATYVGRRPPPHGLRPN
jgi:citrate synthase